MLFVGIVFSAVAMLLGIVTKLPQGGRGLANNLIVLGFFLPAPPFLPPPPPTKILFDLEAAIAENKIFYMRNPVVTKNGTQGPMPRPPLKHRSAGSSNAPVRDATFTTPSFSFPANSLPSQLFKLCGLVGGAIGRIIVVFLALSWPWLVIKYMHLLGNSGPAPRKPIKTGFGDQLWQIDPLLIELQMSNSERDQALAELRGARKETREVGRKSEERNSEKEAALNSLRTERDDAVAELGKEKRKLEKMERGRKEEVEVLKEETKKQLKAWKEEEKKWEEERTDAKKRHKEDTQSWRSQVEGLKMEKEWLKEAFGAKLKNILKGVEEEREGWGKEKEELKKEKEGEMAKNGKMAAEKKGLEEKWVEEKKLWEEADDRAQGRIAELEEDNKRLKNEAANREKRGKEAEVAKKTTEEAKEREQKRSEEEAAEAKKVIDKLEGEVLNGRKLIEDLQADKRRDRQLLLELRAQLVRPTHAAPPSHMNPNRFGGPSAAPMGGPVFAPPFAPPLTTPSAIPKGTFHPILPSPTAVNQEVGSEITPLPPRPVVKLPPAPPRRQITSTGLPGSSLPPPNAPKGPKGSGRR